MKVGSCPPDTRTCPSSFPHSLSLNPNQAHSPRLPALSTSCDLPVWSSHLSSSSNSSRPFCTSPSSYCTISSNHSAAWIHGDRTEEGRAQKQRERERWNEMRWIFFFFFLAKQQHSSGTHFRDVQRGSTQICTEQKMHQWLRWQDFFMVFFSIGMRSLTMNKVPFNIHFLQLEVACALSGWSDTCHRENYRKAGV